jgi:integrative and conjugative element protein (TIGR02256 family)
VSEQDSSIGFASGDGRFGIDLPQDAVQEMLRICRAAGGIETGGILLGQYNKDHTRAIVHTVTGPPPDSQQFFARFLRGVSGLQKLLDQLWNKKDRRFYLGEWHHHPLPIPDPSPDDLTQMQEIACSVQYACPEPLLMILSGPPLAEWRLTAHVLTREGALISLRSSLVEEATSILKIANG